VRVAVRRRKPSYETASLVELGSESSQRVRPRCPHFGVCGGCAMQHLDGGAQLAVRQRALEDALRHIGKVQPERILRPLDGPHWDYRHRARLSVRHVAKKGTVLVGFHERRSSYVADIRSCDVLPPHVSALLLPLRALIGELAVRDRVPQIELAIGDETTALVLRHLEPLGEEDRSRLRAFAALHGIEWWLQSKGPDTVRLLDGDRSALGYALPAFGLRTAFRPTDFTQVNHAINRALVSRAVGLLEPRPADTVIDWFCGLGNFTLPLATRAARVLGIEGSESLVARARQAAAANGLADRTAFACRNLFDMDAAALLALGTARCWLVDPPREGAFAIAKALAEAVAADRADWQPPERIVYVSCNPATLARDAGLLVHLAGYRCAAAGIVNMFPQTAHVESLAVFERGTSGMPGDPSP
jgi:23S rRNA (uracil1939-C5)-methyltransferase